MARARRGTTVRRVYTYGAKNLAARNIQRAWRSKRAVRAHVGESIWNSNCKSTLTHDDFPTTQSTGLLYGLDITQLAQGQEQNQRERGVINCRGFKTQIMFQNLQGSATLYVNIAMIAPKSTDSSGGDIPVNARFFRLNGAQRSLDFNQVGVSPFQRHISSINTDDYTVLWHKRRVLCPNSNGTAANVMNTKNSMWLCNKYTKLSRQIRYGAAESSAATDGRVYLVYWCGVNGFPADPGVTFQISRRCIMYFKEPKQ